MNNTTMATLDHHVLEVSAHGLIWLIGQVRQEDGRLHTVVDLLDEDQALDLARALVASVEMARAID